MNSDWRVGSQVEVIVCRAVSMSEVYDVGGGDDGGLKDVAS